MSIIKPALPDPTHKLCGGCKQIHPIEAYTYYMPKGLAKLHGYTGERRVKLEHKYCINCRPNQKNAPINRLPTMRELRNALAKEYISEGEYSAYMAERDRADRRHKEHDTPAKIKRRNTLLNYPTLKRKFNK